MTNADMTDATATGSGLVMASDRSGAFRLAKRHTIIVRILRTALPVVTLCTAGLYGLSAYDKADWSKPIRDIDVTDFLPTNLVMDNPSYRGYNKDGGSYVVTAKTAKQDFTNFTVMHLNDITGELTNAKKVKTVLTAKTGLFNTKSNQLDLSGGIDIKSEDGLRAQLSTARILPKKNIITSKDPVQVAMSAGTIKSDSFRLLQKEREVSFLQNVVARLTPKKKAKGQSANPVQAGKKTPAAGLISSSDEPVDVYADRLDVYDGKQRAIFSGQVRVIQGDTSMQTQDLEIEYDRESKPKTKQKSETKVSGGLAGGASQVQKIIAKHPVLIKRGKDQEVTSQRAVFDAVQETAVLSENVVMISGADRRAEADKAVLRSKDNTADLSGRVVLIQGRNRLNGRHLHIDRASGVTKLTSPAAGGAAAGRITARFYSGAEKKDEQKAAKAKKAKPENGVIASFATDPSAPIDIESDSLTVREGDKTATFLGKVHAVQGSFTIKTAKLTVNYTGGGDMGDPFAADSVAAANGAAQKKSPAAQLNDIRADGDVVVTSAAGQQAKGQWAKFDTKANMIEVGGNVALSQGKNVVRGKLVSINMTTGKSIVHGAKQVNGSSWDSTVNTKPGGGSTSAKGKVPFKSNRPNAVFFPQDLKKPQAQQKKSPQGTSSAGTAPGATAPKQPASTSSWDALTTTN